MRPALLPLESRTAPAVVTYAAGVLTLPSGETVYAAGVLTLPSGETVTALSGFPGPGDVATDGELTVVGAGVGGGPVVQVYDAAGTMLGSFYAFGEGFRGGVQVGVDADGIRVVPARGSGGGPVLRTFDPLGNLLSSVWVGPPENRDGVYLGAGSRGPVADAPQSAAGVPLDLSRLGVRLIGPGEPTAGEWQGVRDSLAYVPPALVRDYLAAGVSLDAVTGPLTDYPGVPPDYATDFGGVYVPPARSAVYRLGSSAGSVDTLLHELGHAVDAAVLSGASGVGDWLYVWGSVPWPTEYERTQSGEAWAESFARYLRANPGLPVAVRVYFDNLFARTGW